MASLRPTTGLPQRSKIRFSCAVLPPLRARPRGDSDPTAHGGPGLLCAMKHGVVEPDYGPAATEQDSIQLCCVASLASEETRRLRSDRARGPWAALCHEAWRR